MSPPEKVLTIQVAVAEHFGIQVKDMRSKRRPQYIAWPRQIAMHLAREGVSVGKGKLPMPLNTIGEFFKRDHGTVMHANAVVRERCEVDDNDRMTVQAIKEKLAGVLDA